MNSFIDDEESESGLFDPEGIAQGPDLVSDFCLKNWEYDVWVNTPQSVGERRREFIRLTGLVPNRLEEDLAGTHGDGVDRGLLGDIDRIVENNGTVLTTSTNEDILSLSSSSTSSWNTDKLDLCHGACLSECRKADGNSKNSDVLENKKLRRIRVMAKEDPRLDNVSQFSPSVEQFRQRAVEDNSHGYTPRTIERLKERWLSKLRTLTCAVRQYVRDDAEKLDGLNQEWPPRMRRVSVRHSQRKLKELSALFTGQEIQAHEGSILAMKFSPDGQFLASAGEDMILRVWKVVEDPRLDTVDIPDADPSCVFFSLSNLSELGPLMVEKDNKFQNLRKTPDSACIIIPPKVFRIIEKPIHVFEGHTAEILDLSWSKNNCLLSASMDKTVRLWRVGVYHCLKVFYHTDYVTCLQFHPVNDDCFISGSIDGKVRIWTISRCQVVYWSEIRDIITAVSYCPDGQGGIIGFVTGTCRFFEISDDRIQLGAEMCLTNKRSTGKRITGFQFLPQDPSKVLVTSADSHVRILDGLTVIDKYKGYRNAGNHTSASLTSDGKHIISASEDSNIYIWNCDGEEHSSYSQPKVSKSFECFSSNASIAIAWPGLKSSTPEKSLLNPLPFSSTNCFSSTQDSLFSKGSATWPEEKLPASSPKFITSFLSKSQYKLLKTCCRRSSNTHAWGLVIVTAGWDGRIRSFQNYGLPVPL